MTTHRRRSGHFAALFLTLMLVMGFAAIARGGPADRPTISGDPVVGQTLTSSSPGDTGVYKWQRCNPATATCGDNVDKTDPSYVDIFGATGPDQQSYKLTAADLGMVIRVQAKGTSLGQQFVPSAPVGPVGAGAGESVPPPEFLQSGVIDPSCPLEVVEPGSAPITVDHLTNVPVGTRVDVSICRVELATVRNPRGETQLVDLFGGPFKFFQRQHGKPYIVLKLVGKFGSRVPPGAGSSQAGARASGAAFKRCKKLLGKKKCRKLVAKGDCLCSTSGALASGTVRGSRWYFQDGPGYTFAKALVHQLLVRDKVKHKKILLDPGESYLARKRR